MIGSIFVVTIVMGDYVTIGVMGGQQIASVGKVIQVQLTYLQFPLAAANAVVLLAVVLTIIVGHDPPRRHPQGAVGGRTQLRASVARGSVWLGLVFGLFVLFLYGPILTILVLSFQGPTGGLTFPMRGLSAHWFASLWNGLGVVDIWSAFGRSVRLGAVVMALTVVISVLAGYAFRRGFRGATVVFYTAVASLIVPSIVVSLGIGVQFRLLDDVIKRSADARLELGGGPLHDQRRHVHVRARRPPDVDAAVRAADHVRGVQPLRPAATKRRHATSAPRPGRPSATSCCRSSRPRWSASALFGFTLSWDEVARSSQAIGSDQNTLPLELTGLTTTVTNPEIYALGTVTTGVSFAVIWSLCCSSSARFAAPRASPSDQDDVEILVVNPNTTASMTEEIGRPPRARPRPARGSSP